MMSAWEGAELAHNLFGMPHVTKIARKPKGVGTEFKCAADCESGIMLFLEIQEGKSRMPLKEFANQFPFHCAVTLRCVKAWFGSLRKIIADSAFASYLTAQELLKRGLYFQGIVKTATRLFPMQHFKNWVATNPPRGSHEVCVATVEAQGGAKPIMAVAWKDKQVKFLIATAGTTLPGTPVQKQRSKVVADETTGELRTQKFTKSVQCPVVVNQLFDGFNTIDVHDHYRQGSLALEMHNKTHKWWHRNFTSLLGVIVTDAFFMYRLDYLRAHHGSSHGMDSFFDWVGKLAHQLIFDFDQQPNLRSSPSSKNGSNGGNNNAASVSIFICCIDICFKCIIFDFRHQYT
jgi:hypothetical protein